MHDIELITTGSELLNGRTLNRHAGTLGAALAPLGFRLTRDTTLPDDVDAIAVALREAMGRVDFVMLSGGLGPTSDDITRDAVGRELSRSVAMDDASLEVLKERYRAWGRPMTDAAERQALVVEGAVALPNSVGAAPGERLHQDGKVIFVLPGPPGEFSAVLEEGVLPWLTEHFGGHAPVPERIFLTSGVGESDLVTLFEDAGFPGEGIDIAFCAAPGRIELRLSSPAHDAGLLERAADRLRELAGEYIFAEDRVEMEDVVLRGLDRLGARLATIEAGTGGLLMHRLATATAMTACYAGGMVVNTHDIVVHELGVEREELAEHGVASEVIASRLAEAIRIRFDADYGLCLTGFAETSGETGRVWAAVSGGAGNACRPLRISPSLALRTNRRRGSDEAWSSQQALNLLRRHLSQDAAAGGEGA